MRRINCAGLFSTNETSGTIWAKRIVEGNTWWSICVCWRLIFGGLTVSVSFFLWFQTKLSFEGSFAKQESIPVGCVPFAAVAIGVMGGVCRGVSTQGGCLPRGGVSAWGVSERHPTYEQNDWQTVVKTLPYRNFVTDGNKKHDTWRHQFLLTFSGQVSFFLDVLDNIFKSSKVSLLEGTQNIHNIITNDMRTIPTWIRFKFQYFGWIRPSRATFIFP